MSETKKNVKSLIVVLRVYFKNSIKVTVVSMRTFSIFARAGIQTCTLMLLVIKRTEFPKIATATTDTHTPKKTCTRTLDSLYETPLKSIAGS